MANTAAAKVNLVHSKLLNYGILNIHIIVNREYAADVHSSAYLATFAAAIA